MRVQAWMVPIHFHGVVISIAGCVEEMVCDPKSQPSSVPLNRGSSLNPDPVSLVLPHHATYDSYGVIV